MPQKSVLEEGSGVSPSSATASGLPDAVPTTTGGDCDGDLPVPRWKASAHARVCDDAGPARISRSRHGPSRLLLDGKHQRPELVLRRSIPSLRTPLSTLRLQPHDRTRMTRGRCGSLRLHRNGLAPSTFRRSPGAPVHSINKRHRGEIAANQRRPSFSDCADQDSFQSG